MINSKSLIIFALSSQFLGASAFAQLPDEVNYPLYKGQFESLAELVDAITARLETAQYKLESAYSRETSIIENIDQLESDNSSMRHNINIKTDRREKLTVIEADLLYVINKLSSRLSNLDYRRNQIFNKIAREDRKLEPIRRRISQLRQEIGNRKTSLSRVEESLRGAESRLVNMRATVATLQIEKRTLRQKLKKLNEQYANIDSNLADEQTKLANVRSKIEPIKTRLENKKTKLVTAKTKLSEIITKLASIPRSEETKDQVIKLRQKKKEQTLVVANLKAEVDTIKGRLTALKTKKKNLTAKVANLQRKKINLPAQIERAKAIFARKRAAFKNKSAVLDRFEAEIVQERRNVRQLSSDLVATLNNLNRVKNRLITESATLNRLYSDQDSNNRAIARTEQKLNSNSNEYEAVTNEIMAIDNALPILTKNIANNETSIDAFTIELGSTRSDIQNLTMRVANLEDEQSVEITRRDRKYQEYQARLSYFNLQLSDAQNSGSTQADVAFGMAVTDSNIYVASRSKSLGEKVGSELAGAQANLWSSVRSEIKGYSTGFDIGHANTTEQSRGEAEGTAAGIRKAQDYADRVLKPQFFNEKFADLFQKSTAALTIGETFSKVSMDAIYADSSENLRNFMATIAPITKAEVEESLEIRTDLDSSIENFKNNLAKTIQQKRSLSKAANVYDSPATIPYQTVDCSSVYKNLSEFRTACKNSYSSSFESNYITEYSKNFFGQYNQMYLDHVNLTQAAQIEGLYNMAFEKFYPVAEGSGIAAGKLAIFQETFKTSKIAGYNNELPRAADKADKDAQNEVITWVEDNATLTLASAKMPNVSLKGGSTGVAQLDIKNLSKISLSKPVKIVVTNTKNVDQVQAEYFIQKANGSQTTTFNDISFKVSENVKSNQTISISGKIYFSGGKYDQQRVENFNAKALTALNPAAAVEYDYTKSPRVISRFRRRTIVHSLKLKISPKVESINAGYIVKISVPDEFKKMIKLKKVKSVKTKALKHNEQTEVKFKYTFPRSSRGKEVFVKVTFEYKGEVIKSRLIQLKPF